MLLASWASQSKCCISWDERRLALKTVQHLTVLENVCFVSGLISCHVRQFPDPSKLRESLVSPQYMFPQQDLCGAHASNNNISHPPCRWIIMLGANVQVGCTSHDCLVCIIYIYMFVYILMYACVLSNFFMYAVYVYIYIHIDIHDPLVARLPCTPWAQQMPSKLQSRRAKKWWNPKRPSHAPWCAKGIFVKCLPQEFKRFTLNKRHCYPEIETFGTSRSSRMVFLKYFFVYYL